MKANTTTGKSAVQSDATQSTAATAATAGKAGNSNAMTQDKTAGLTGSSNQQYAKNKAATSAQKENKKGDKEETPFEKLFTDLLKDTYWAEQHIVDSLPKMIQAATTDSLKEAFEDHLHQTRKHVSRLERVFRMLDKPAEAVKCVVMEALVKEGEKVIKETPEGSMTRDAGLIISAQKIEHYEIAAYGSLVQIALTLQHDDVATLLEQTLSEEEDTDQQLTEIAETDVNPMADHEDQDDQEGQMQQSVVGAYEYGDEQEE